MGDRSRDQNPAMLFSVMDVRTWIERQRESHDRRDRETAGRMGALSPAERADLQRSLSQSMMKVILAMPADQRDAVLKTRTPLPESSVRALARLRANHGRSATRR